jgi:mannose-6-phosphate isomerase-like protein (cupin superfamily)
MPYHWHQVKNIGDEPLKILEIQYGSYLEEDDIEREEIL